MARPDCPDYQVLYNLAEDELKRGDVPTESLAFKVLVIKSLRVRRIGLCVVTLNCCSCAFFWPGPPRFDCKTSNAQILTKQKNCDAASRAVRYVSDLCGAADLCLCCTAPVNTSEKTAQSSGAHYDAQIRFHSVQYAVSCHVDHSVFHSSVHFSIGASVMEGYPCKPGHQAAALRCHREHDELIFSPSVHGRSGGRQSHPCGRLYRNGDCWGMAWLLAQ